MFLENAAALAKLGDPGIPGAALRDRDLEGVFGGRAAHRARKRQDGEPDGD